MKGATFFFFLLYPILFLFPQSGKNITFSEVMFNSAAVNGEFIEIYNLSPTESIDLSCYKIKYQTSSLDTIIYFDTSIYSGNKIILYPRSYAVVFEGDYDILSGIYNALVPDTALILRINNNAFGSSGMSNTSDRTLYLLNEKNDTIDIYTYSADNQAGYSDEKIFQDKDNSKVNWTNSKIKNGTPGKANSAARDEYEITISSIDVSPPFPAAGDEVSLIINIKNSGIRVIESWSIEVFNQKDFDSSETQNERIYFQGFVKFYPEDSVKLNIVFLDTSSGLKQITAKIQYSTPNNTLIYRLVKEFQIKPVPAKFNDIVINEIMYAPRPEETEWVELYNQSEKPVNLKKWKLSDNSTSGELSAEDIVLAPGHFIVLCKDSAIVNNYNIPSGIIKFNLPSLNNSGDAIVLSDSIGRTIDSIKYHPLWGGTQGRSLERIWSGSPSNMPENWGTCILTTRGSPGCENSICPKRYDPEIIDVFFNPALPLVNNNVIISVKVKNSGRLESHFNIQLSEDIDLDSLPDKLLEYSEELILSPGDSLVYTFRFFITTIRTERAFSIKILSETDQDTGNNNLYKLISPGYAPNSLVINEIMYAPSDKEPEWIELYNNTEDTICLKNWRLSDVLSVPSFITLTSNKAKISPRGYVVLAKDSSIFFYHKKILSDVITLNLPALNNDEDAIVLKDSRGVTIDSVRYLSIMGGTNGFSLERKSPEIYSDAPGNWNSSLDISKSTPGQINSISRKNFDLAVDEISIEPLNVIQGDSIYVNITLLNKGINDIQNFSVDLFYKASGSAEEALIAAFPMLSLKKSSSLVLRSPDPIYLENSIILCAKIIFTEDEDTTNNSLGLKVNPGYGRNSIVINEVMYFPNENEPEWFELLNNSEKNINLTGWSFSTLSNAQTKYTISLDNLIILPGKFLVISKDSLLANYHPDLIQMKVINFKTLSNSTDGIVLYDSKGNCIDSIKYSSCWGGRNGRSLERFSSGVPTCDSTNWATSISKASSTPGHVNSTGGLSLYTRNSIIINEIMYEPASDNSEFIELFNNGNDDIDLAGWQVFNKSGNYNLISENSLLLPKGKFFVLAADSLIFQNYSGLFSSGICHIAGQSPLELSNTQDIIVIKDAFGNVIDSVCYFDKWHNSSITNTKNKSLERVNPLVSSNSRSNWNSSINPAGASPGEMNSIYVINQKADKKFSVLPNPFSPDNDGLEDYTIINYNFDEHISDIRIKIFDSRGRLVRTLFSHTPGPRGSLIFDGLDEHGTPLRIGIYILLLEELGSNSATIETIKSVVVVARKL